MPYWISTHAYIFLPCSESEFGGKEGPSVDVECLDGQYEWFVVSPMSCGEDLATGLDRLLTRHDWAGWNVEGANVLTDGSPPWHTLSSQSNRALVVPSTKRNKAYFLCTPVAVTLRDSSGKILRRNGWILVFFIPEVSFKEEKTRLDEFRLRVCQYNVNTFI